MARSKVASLLTLLTLFALAPGCATAGTTDDDGGGATGDAGDAGAKPDSGAADSGKTDTGSSGCTMPFIGALATYDFAAELGTQATTAPKSSAPGVSAGAFGRSNGLTPVAGTGSINSSGWPIAGALDPTKYYTFTLTPDPSCAIDVSSIAIATQSSGTGPTAAAITTSSDGFSQATSFMPTSNGAVNVTVSGTPGGQLEVRVHGWAAGATGGTFRVQNTLTVTGALR